MRTTLHSHPSLRARTRPCSFSKLPLLLAMGALSLWLAGCSPLSPGDAAGQVSSGSILFSDDFSKPPSGWGTWDGEDARVGYYKGGLRIQVDQPQYDFWSVAGKSFRDVQIEVEATKNSGPDDNDFGLICRYRNKDNFYLLVASNDGYYGIAKIKDGQYSMIGADQLQYSQAIGKGKATNRLRADCVGSTLRLYVNGKKLMEGQDSDHALGDVGVLAGAYDQKGVDILFNRFVVKKP